MRFRNTQQNVCSQPDALGRMRVWLAAICLTFVALSAATPMQAEDWMFRRSYFSHELPPSIAARYPRPASRSAYRIPYARGDGFAVRGGYRINRIYLQSGNSTDTTYIYENWFGFRD